MGEGGRIAGGVLIVGGLIVLIGFIWMQENNYDLEDVTFGQVKSDALEAFVNLEDMSIGEIQAYATDRIKQIALTDEFGNSVAVYLPPSSPISENAIDQFRVADSIVELKEAYDILQQYPSIAGFLPEFDDFGDWISEPENQELLGKEDIFKHETKLQKFQVDTPSFGIGAQVNGTEVDVTTNISSGGLGSDYKYRILSNNNPSGLPLVYLGENIVVAGKIKIVDPTCKKDCPTYINGPHYYRGEFKKIDGTEDGKFLYATKAREQTSISGDWGIKLNTGNKTPFYELGTYELQIHTATADDPPRPFIFTIQFQLVEDPSKVRE